MEHLLGIQKYINNNSYLCDSQRQESNLSPISISARPTSTGRILRRNRGYGKAGIVGDENTSPLRARRDFEEGGRRLRSRHAKRLPPRCTRRSFLGSKVAQNGIGGSNPTHSPATSPVMSPGHLSLARSVRVIRKLAAAADQKGSWNLPLLVSSEHFFVNTLVTSVL